MSYVKCPLCSAPIFAQQYDWNYRFGGGVRLVTAWDMTYWCAKGCGWGVAVPCNEDGEVTWTDE